MNHKRENKTIEPILCVSYTSWTSSFEEKYMAILSQLQNITIYFYHQ